MNLNRVDKRVSQSFSWRDQLVYISVGPAYLLLPPLEPPCKLNTGSDERWESVPDTISALGEMSPGGLE